MKLIILAAGKGKRFLSTTKTTAKGMILISSEPLLKHVLLPYLSHVDDIIFVVNNELGMQIRECFGENYQGHSIFYKIQNEQKGTMDALLTCKDLIKKDELFCVGNGDDLLKTDAIEKAVAQNVVGLGVSKKLMPKNYLGVKIESGYLKEFIRHETNEENVEDTFCNGFGILDNRVFDFLPISTRDGELGLPHTLFENIVKYPLKAFIFDKWETVNRPEDIPNAEKFLQNL